MAIINLGQHNLTINENDLILDNEISKNEYRYVIVTQEVGSSINAYHPVMPRTLFNDLRRHGMIYTSNELRQRACDKEKSTTVTYWKFKMDLMNEFYG
ncbi:MAG: hypothetical protein FWC77_05090 [Defluviitaleaceae bacterium]|nr:hypothetical protein [Defluviitaleaceae bacterium]